jgi:dihydroorotate dehydrogenase electron transfer subunit
MKQGIFEIVFNRPIAKNTYEMKLAGDAFATTAAGQFVNIKLDGFFLRRPFSVSDFDKDSLLIVYKTVGRGTEEMAKLKSGEKLDLLTGLGNGFDIKKSGSCPLLIGGGCGVSPLLRLCRDLVKEGRQTAVILGFNSADEVFYEDEFLNAGAAVYITTMDGSRGIKGLVTDAMSGLDYSYFYTCGPEPMMRAVYDVSKTSGQLSFEERMGCGFGACAGCTCKTKYGNKRICREGPVLLKEEIIW